MTIAGVFETRIHVGKRRFAKHASIAKPLHDVTMRRFRPARGARIEIESTPSQIQPLSAFAPHAGRGLKFSPPYLAKSPVI